MDPICPSAPNIADSFSTVTGSVVSKMRTVIPWTVLDSHKQFFFNRDVNAMIHGDEKAHPMLPIWDFENRFQLKSSNSSHVGNCSQTD